MDQGIGTTDKKQIKKESLMTAILFLFVLLWLNKQLVVSTR